MRTFSCLTHDQASAVPTLSFILAADEERARVLVRRELMDVRDAVRVEVREQGRVLWTEVL